jgi:hypothetical protein
MAKRDSYEDAVTDPANRRMRKASGRVNIDSKLVSFLYLLLRDEVTPGYVEELLRKMTNSETGELDVENQYTNGWLALYAQDIAKRLVE